MKVVWTRICTTSKKDRQANWEPSSRKREKLLTYCSTISETRWKIWRNKSKLSVIKSLSRWKSVWKSILLLTNRTAVRQTPILPVKFPTKTKLVRVFLLALIITIQLKTAISRVRERATSFTAHLCLTHAMSMLMFKIRTKPLAQLPRINLPPRKTTVAFRMSSTINLPQKGR